MHGYKQHLVNCKSRYHKLIDGKELEPLRDLIADWRVDEHLEKMSEDSEEEDDAAEQRYSVKERNKSIRVPM